MKNKLKITLFLLIMFILMISIVSINAFSEKAENSDKSYEILLKSRHFVPVVGITDETKAKIESIPGRAHVLIQLYHTPTIKEREELEAKGIKLLSYIPNEAWFASIPSDKSEEIAALSNVRAISEIIPEDKISPIIRERGVGNHAINEDGTVNLIVTTQVIKLFAF